MGKYRKLPIVVDAWRWIGRPLLSNGGVALQELLDLGCPVKVTGRWAKEGHPEQWTLVLRPQADSPNAQINQYIDLGDWIIRGVNGEWYSIKPDVFEKTYIGTDESLDNPQN